MGTGSALPQATVTNDDLSKIMDTSDEWIRTRTGIETRHLAQEETTVSLSVEAARRALCDSGISAEELAGAGGGFHYELLCGISKRVPRVYVKDGKTVTISDISGC